MVTMRRLIKKGGPDFYPTPIWGTKALMKHEKFKGTILEPCCGEGDMSKILKTEGNKVISYDLYDRGFGRQKDFFKIKGMYDNIVTNPPFNIAEDIFHHAFPIVKRKLCLFLRSAFVESIGRYERIFSQNPPSRLLIFSRRISLYPKGTKISGGGTVSYAWFIWDKQQKEKQTKMIWMHPEDGRK